MILHTMVKAWFHKKGDSVSKVMQFGILAILVSVQLQSERALKICGRDIDCKGLTCPQGKKLKCGDDRINELQNICVCEETIKKRH